jgi:hypothetical protein
MGMYAPKQKSIFSQLFSGMKSLFSGSQSVPNTSVPTQVQTSVPQFYQVTANDNSMSDVANQLGAPLPDLVNANNGVKSLPPKGSFISLPTYGPPNPNDLGYDPAMRGRSYGATNPQTTWQQNLRGDPAMQAMRDQAAAIQTSATAPQEISSTLLPLLTINGQPATPEAMQAQGYTFDPITQKWNLSNQQGSGVPQSDNNYMTNPALRLVVHGRNAHNRRNRYTETAKHATTMYKRKKHGAGQAVATGTPKQTTETANTVLGLHLGSG